MFLNQWWHSSTVVSWLSPIGKYMAPVAIVPITFQETQNLGASAKRQRTVASLKPNPQGLR